MTPALDESVFFFIFIFYKKLLISINNDNKKIKNLWNGDYLVKKYDSFRKVVDHKWPVRLLTTLDLIRQIWTYTNERKVLEQECAAKIPVYQILDISNYVI